MGVADHGAGAHPEPTLDRPHAVAFGAQIVDGGVGFAHPVGAAVSNGPELGECGFDRGFGFRVLVLGC